MHKESNASSGPQQTDKNTFAKFLIDSGYNPLAFLGKCMKYFGAKAVIVFFIGAASVYLYALFRPLPFVENESPCVTLKGEVRTLDGQPLTEDFQVGILEDIYGPFKSESGSFSLLVSKRETYGVVVWNRSYNTFKLYGDMRAERKENHYELEDSIVFPTGLGRVEGEVKDKDGRPVKGTVAAGGRCATIREDGQFELTHVPLGKVTLSVKDAKQQSLYEEEILLDLTQPTPKYISIMKE